MQNFVTSHNNLKNPIEGLISRYPRMILIILWFVFIALPIGNRGLWSPDEPRYLQVAWEMSRAESYLIPIMNGDIYAEKPPLYFWLTMLASKVFPWESASRWVSAVASLGVVLLTFSLGRIAGNRQIGFTAALILMTASLFSLLMNTGNIDTTLTLLTTLSLFFFVRWHLKADLKSLVCAYIACGVGILAKGPVALLIPWLAFVAWEMTKRLKGEKAAFLHLLWGPLIALAIAGAWVIPACIAGGEEYTRIILFQQQLDRAVDSYVHLRPWYEYLITFPVNVLPWFIVLVGAMPELRKLLREKDPEILLFVLWFCTTFIFFSLISSKRERYLLPCYPVFSVLLSHAVANWSARRESSRSIQITALMTMIGVLALMVFPLILPFLRNQLPVLAIFPLAVGDWRLWTVYLLGVVAVSLLWEGVQLAKAKRPLTACNLIAFAFLAAVGISQTFYIPYIDPVKSARGASKTIQMLLPSAGTVAFYNRRFDNGWNFYLDRAKIPVITDEDIRRNQPRYDVIILRQKHLELLKAVLNMENYRIAAVEPVGSKNFVLLQFNSAQPN